MARRIEAAQNVALGSFLEERLFNVERAIGPDFEALVGKIQKQIRHVAEDDKDPRKLIVHLEGDVSWHHGVKSKTGRETQDTAALKLIARAATYIAAKQHLEGDSYSIGLTVEERGLSVEASGITNKWPWSNNEGDPKAKWGLRPVSVKESLRENPDALIDTARARLVNQRRFPFVILSSASVLAACSSLAEARPAEVSPIPTSTIAPETQIAPSPRQEIGDMIVISQDIILENEVFEIGGEDLKNAYLDFQEQTKLQPDYADAEFEAWGIKAKTVNSGSIISPFFEARSPEGISFISMVISLENGGFRALKLESAEVTFEEKSYLTLALTTNAETQEPLENPEPIFWIPFSLEEWNGLTPEEQSNVKVLFNGLGGIIPQTEPLQGGSKLASIREIVSPGPNHISVKELLSECPVELELSSNLKGQVAVNGEVIFLNYPDLTTNITIALHSAILTRGGQTYLPQYDRVYLNPNFESVTGIDPARQLVTDLWFGHYSAWQHDQDDRFFEQRKNTTFTGYLDMVSKGGDGSHMLWVKTTQNGIYPQTEQRIDPRTMDLVVIYYDDLRGFGGGLARSPAYEEFNNVLIWPLGLTYAGGPPYTPDYWLVKYYGYRYYSETFTHLSANSDLQKYGYGNDMSANPQISRERYHRSLKIFEQIRAVYLANQFEVFPQSYPLEMHSSGFK